MDHVPEIFRKTQPAFCRGGETVARKAWLVLQRGELFKIDCCTAVRDSSHNGQYEACRIQLVYGPPASFHGGGHCWRAPPLRLTTRTFFLERPAPRTRLPLRRGPLQEIRIFQYPCEQLKKISTSEESNKSLQKRENSPQANISIEYLFYRLNQPCFLNMQPYIFYQ